MTPSSAQQTSVCMSYQHKILNSEVNALVCANFSATPGKFPTTSAVANPLPGSCALLHNRPIDSVYLESIPLSERCFLKLPARPPNSTA